MHEYNDTAAMAAAFAEQCYHGSSSLRLMLSARSFSRRRSTRAPRGRGASREAHARFDRSMDGRAAKAAPKDSEKQSEIVDARKAFRTTELKIRDIVGYC